jgi:predicted ATPase
MARRRDVRRFGPGPYVLGLRRDIATCDYDDLDTVRLMRGFLEAPDRYLRAALGEDG